MTGVNNTFPIVVGTYMLLNPGTFWQRIAVGVICVFVLVISLVISVLVGLFLDDIIVNFKGKKDAG